MIENAYINKRECVLDPLGDANIRLGGFCYTRRVVVVRENRCSVVRKGLLDNDPWMNRSTVDGSEEQVFDGDYAVPIIEEDAREDFVWFLPKLAAQKFLGGLGARQYLTSLVAL